MSSVTLEECAEIFALSGAFILKSAAFDRDVVGAREDIGVVSPQSTNQVSYIIKSSSLRCS